MDFYDFTFEEMFRHFLSWGTPLLTAIAHEHFELKYKNVNIYLVPLFFLEMACV